MSDFFDLYRRPEWQEKRLRIMERAEFKCEHCDATDQELHIHHRYYEKGNAPWEYPDYSLECLCHKCHDKVEENKKRLARALGQVSSLQLEKITSYVIALAMADEGQGILQCHSYDDADGISGAFDVDVDVVISLSNNGKVSVSDLKDARSMRRKITWRLESFFRRWCGKKAQ